MGLLACWRPGQEKTKGRLGQATRLQHQEQEACKPRQAEAATSWLAKAGFLCCGGGRSLPEGDHLRQRWTDIPGLISLQGGTGNSSCQRADQWASLATQIFSQGSVLILLTSSGTVLYSNVPIAAWLHECQRHRASPKEPSRLGSSSCSSEPVLLQLLGEQLNTEAELAVTARGLFKATVQSISADALMLVAGLEPRQQHMQPFTMTPGSGRKGLPHIGKHKTGTEPASAVLSTGPASGAIPAIPAPGTPAIMQTVHRPPKARSSWHDSSLWDDPNHSDGMFDMSSRRPSALLAGTPTISGLQSGALYEKCDPGTSSANTLSRIQEKLYERASSGVKCSISFESRPRQQLAGSGKQTFIEEDAAPALVQTLRANESTKPATRFLLSAVASEQTTPDGPSFETALPEHALREGSGVPSSSSTFHSPRQARSCTSSMHGQVPSLPPVLAAAMMSEGQQALHGRQGQLTWDDASAPLPLAPSSSGELPSKHASRRSKSQHGIMQTEACQSLGATPVATPPSTGKVLRNFSQSQLNMPRVSFNNQPGPMTATLLQSFGLDTLILVNGSNNPAGGARTRQLYTCNSGKSQSKSREHARSVSSGGQHASGGADDSSACSIDEHFDMRSKSVSRFRASSCEFDTPTYFARAETVRGAGSSQQLLATNMGSFSDSGQSRPQSPYRGSEVHACMPHHGSSATPAASSPLRASSSSGITRAHSAVGWLPDNSGQGPSPLMLSRQASFQESPEAAGASADFRPGNNFLLKTQPLETIASEPNTVQQSDSVRGNSLDSLRLSSQDPQFVVEVTVRAVPHPDYELPLRLVCCQDVSARSAVEALLMQMTETQLGMVSQMFPLHVIEQLTQRDRVSKLPPPERDTVRFHQDVTILFLDIVNFTVMSKEVDPHQVMTYANELFSLLDDLVTHHGLHKVETAGDCYIVAAGVVEKGPGGFLQVVEDHDPAESARAVLAFAKDMLQTSSKVRMPHNQSHTQVRVGIHTGNCTSGLVGSQLPKWSIYGDSINTASRMESTGLPGRIQVSSATHDLLPEENWEARQDVMVKGKGTMMTYLWVPTPPSDGGDKSSLLGSSVYLPTVQETEEDSAVQHGYSVISLPFRGSTHARSSAPSRFSGSNAMFGDNLIGASGTNLLESASNIFSQSHAVGGRSSRVSSGGSDDNGAVMDRMSADNARMTATTRVAQALCALKRGPAETGASLRRHVHWAAPPPLTTTASDALQFPWQIAAARASRGSNQSSEASPTHSVRTAGKESTHNSGRLPSLMAILAHRASAKRQSVECSTVTTMDPALLQQARKSHPHRRSVSHVEADDLQTAPSMPSTSGRLETRGSATGLSLACLLQAASFVNNSQQAPSVGPPRHP